MRPLWCVLILSILTVGPARAATVFQNSFGSGTSFNIWTTGQHFTGSPGGWQLWVSFSLSTRTSLAGMTALRTGPGASGAPPVGPMTLAIMDASRTTELYRLTATATTAVLYQPTPLTGSTYAWNVTYTLPSTVIAAGQYWIGFDTAIWSGTTAGSNNSSLQVRPAHSSHVRRSDILFSLQGSSVAAVPLPAGGVLLLAGLLGAGRFARRRQSGPEDRIAG